MTANILTGDSSLSALPGIRVLCDQACSSELAQASALAIPNSCDYVQVEVAGVLCPIEALPHSIHHIFWVHCINEQALMRPIMVS